MHRLKSASHKVTLVLFGIQYTSSFSILNSFVANIILNDIITYTVIVIENLQVNNNNKKLLIYIF